MCDYTRIAAEEFVSIFIYFCVNFMKSTLVISSFPWLVDVGFIHHSFVVNWGACGLGARLASANSASEDFDALENYAAKITSLLC